MRRTKRASVALASVFMASLLPMASASAAGPTPVAQWTFDEGTGSTTNDVIGSLDGTLTAGATLTAGSAPQGMGYLTVDGSGYVNVPTASILEPSGDFTVAVWVKGADPSPTAEHVVLEKGAYGCTGPSWGLDARQRPASVVGMVDLTMFGFHTEAGGPLDPDQWDQTWHPVVMVVEPSIGRTTMYADGHRTFQAWPVASDTVQYGSTGRTNADLHIGGVAATCPFRTGFVGSIDDVRLYGGALSQTQILALLPDYPTNTAADLFLSNHAVDPVSTAYADEDLMFRAHVTPYPGIAGDVTWLARFNGGPEQAIGTSTVDPAVTKGYGFLVLAAGTLQPGAYQVRASWPGQANWLASISSSAPMTISKRPITMTVEPRSSGLLPGETATLTATLTIPTIGADARFSGESVTFVETTGGSDVTVGSAPINFIPDGTGHYANIAWLTTPPVVEGAHTYEARYLGTAMRTTATAATAVLVGKQPGDVWLAARSNPIKASETTSVEGFVRTYRTGGVESLPDPTGSVQVQDGASGPVLGTVPINHTGSWELQLPPLALGTHQLVARYSGDVNFQDSTSEPYALEVAADTVDATDVGRNYSTFYPVKDGYRDTLTVEGLRDEVISVAIRIYSPKGKLLKAVSIPQETGKYSYKWSGRTSSGAIRAAGKYKIVQTLTDAVGTKKVVTAYSNISMKKLVYRTAYITKKGSSLKVAGTAGTGKVYTSNTGYAKTVAGGNGWAGVGWQLTLPKASAYKSISFQASIKGPKSAPPTTIGVQDFAVCGYAATWDIGCFRRMKSVGSQSGTKWYSVGATPATYRHGRYVRGAISSYFGTHYIYKVRLKVTYGILR